MSGKSRQGFMTGVASLLLVLGAGSAAGQTPPVRPASASSSSSHPIESTRGTGRSQADYAIGPGDTLQVFVWRNPELSVTVPVRPDGKVSTPLVDDVVAVGKTPTQLAREMEAILSEYVRSPEVNIIVTTVASALSHVKVVGEVRTPQAIPYRKGLTVLDVVLAAGGLTEYAAGNRSKLVRMVEGKPKEIRLRLHDLLNRGAIKHNVELQPGDVLFVPESRL